MDTDEAISFSYRGRDGCELHAAQVSSTEGESTAERGAPIVVLLHGGGPDHRSLVPLARRLADSHAVLLPDVRGYGRSVCRDPAKHTWARYADDVVDLLDHVGAGRAIVGGAGLGGTIALRTALAYPERVQAAVLMSVEDIEEDEKKKAEVAFMDAFAARVRSEGIEAAWAPTPRPRARNRRDGARGHPEVRSRERGCGGRGRRRRTRSARATSATPSSSSTASPPATSW
jgi:3-oxoadipate enol-lactonase